VFAGFIAFLAAFCEKNHNLRKKVVTSAIQFVTMMLQVEAKAAEFSFQRSPWLELQFCFW